MAKGNFFNKTTFQNKKPFYLIRLAANMVLPEAGVAQTKIFDLIHAAFGNT